MGTRLIFSVVMVASITAHGKSNDEVDAVCGSLFSSLNDPQARENLSLQKQSYCKTAKEAAHAHRANRALTGVWAAVAGVCAATCASSLAGAFYNQYICMGSNLAGSITDAAVTKQFTSVAMSLTSAGMGYMMSRQANEAGKTLAYKGQVKKLKNGKKLSAKNGGKVGKDIGACISAATASVQAIVKGQASKLHKKTMNDALNKARELDDNEGPTLDGFNSDPLASAHLADPALTTSVANLDLSPTAVSTCEQAKATGDTSLTLQCAIAQDRELPRAVNTQEFADGFKKATEMDLGEFLQEDAGAKKKVFAATANHLGSTPEKAALLKESLDHVALNIPTGKETDTLYVGRGGGAGGTPAPKGENMMGQMGKMMKGLMGQLNGQKPEEQKPNSRFQKFAARYRNPASVAKDPSISIFDRLSYRYQLVHRNPPGGRQ